jgi:hypothetical protein
MHITINYCFLLKSHLDIKHAISKLAPYLTDKTQAVNKIALSLLIELYTNYKEEFLSQLLLLPINLQLETRRALSPRIPNIDIELANSLKRGSTMPDNSNK